MKIQNSLIRGLYQLCMRLHEERAIYNKNDVTNNHNMGLVRWLGARTMRTVPGAECFEMHTA
jgi:hypothetical protein